MTPAMDGLFTGPGAERRRFLDRLILCFDPGYRTRAGRFERAMQQRNRLLADGVRDSCALRGPRIAHGGDGHRHRRGARRGRCRPRGDHGRAHGARSAFAVSRGGPGPRRRASKRISNACRRSRSRTATPQRLREGRERDRAAGRTLDGPHRSDLLVAHAPKAMPARLCSTGEQKALLIGLVLAHAELVAAPPRGRADPAARRGHGASRRRAPRRAVRGNPAPRALRPG